jgi:hypothetical protein
MPDKHYITLKDNLTGEKITIVSAYTMQEIAIIVRAEESAGKLIAVTNREVE